MPNLEFAGIPPLAAPIPAALLVAVPLLSNQAGACWRMRVAAMVLAAAAVWYLTTWLPSAGLRHLSAILPFPRHTMSL